MSYRLIWHKGWFAWVAKRETRSISYYSWARWPWDAKRQVWQLMASTGAITGTSGWQP